MKKILILDVPSFPFGFAYSEKIKQIGRIISSAGNQAIIINKIPTLQYNDKTKVIKEKGIYEGIIYYYTCGNPFKKKNKIVNYLSSVKGFFNEFRFIVANYKKENINCIILSYSWYPYILYYRLLTKLFGIKLFISIMEYHRVANNPTFLAKIKAALFDNYSYFLSNKVITISHALTRLVEKNYSDKPVFQLPVLADYNQILPVEGEKNGYLLYCGGAGYYDVIEFIIDSYREVRKIKEIKLVLIIHGNNDKIKELITNYGLEKEIRLLSDISYSELVKYYQNAEALLIPLRPVLQDIYRFPQKIAEYLASGRPIITTAVGEITYYFKDGVSAFISDTYKVNAFSKKILECLDDKSFSQKVGEEGRIVGLKNFHIDNYIMSFNKFLFE